MVEFTWQRNTMENGGEDKSAAKTAYGVTFPWLCLEFCASFSFPCSSTATNWYKKEKGMEINQIYKKLAGWLKF